MINTHNFTNNIGSKLAFQLKALFVGTLLLAHPCPAFSETYSADYGEALIGGATYSLKCKWLIPDIGEITDWSKANYRTNIIYNDGAIYLNIQHSYPIPELEKFDAATGATLGAFPIDWNGYEYSKYSAFYAGNDSNGTPYVASLGGTFSGEVFPFCIYPIYFAEDGTPTAAARYVLQTNPDWYNGSPSIVGSLKDDNFYVAASYRSTESLLGPDQTKTGVALWKVTSKQTTPILAYANATLSVTLALPINDNHVLIYDRGTQNRYSTADYHGAIPTIFEITPDHSLIAESTFDGDITNELGNGLAFFSMNGVNLMAYSKGNFVPSYAIAQMNNYPRLENSTNLWSIAHDEYSHFDICNNDQESNTIQAIVAPDNLSADLYTLTNRLALAAYHIEYQSGELTGVIPATNPADNISEIFYNLHGQRIDKTPSAPGIYIIKKGDEVKKIFVQ